MLFRAIYTKLCSFGCTIQRQMASRATPERPRLTREDVAAAREVAELLGLPLSTVFDFARRGLLPGHKLGRRWIFLHDELEASLRRPPRTTVLRSEPPPPLLPAARKTSPRRQRSNASGDTAQSSLFD
jgi:excisionase family DNA binding protein